MRKRFTELAHGEEALDWVTDLADKHQVQLYMHATLPATSNSISQVEFIDLAVKHDFKEEGDYDLIYTLTAPLSHVKLG